VKKPLGLTREEEIACPSPERSGQPLGQRNRESHFLAIDKNARDVFVENLSEDPFAPALTHLEFAGKAPGKFYHSVIQDRDARLQTDRHARPIHLRQEVIGKVRRLISQHHPLHESERSPALDPAVRIHRRTADHEIVRILPC